MSPKAATALFSTSIPALGAPRRGKVRDLYELGDRLLIVACDRVSAYDHVLRPGIPDKGKILNQLSNFWFASLSDVVPNHLLATEFEHFPPELAAFRDQLEGRSVLVRRAEVVPFECVVRGFLAGSAFRAYQREGAICGVALPAGLLRASRLPDPIFTPTTKAAVGHDEEVTFATLVEQLGTALAHRIRDLALTLYARGAEIAAGRGLILADTKFELGLHDGELLLIDEVLTPDSSRYWDASQWRAGEEPVSFDKQPIRDWLDASGWDHHSEPPELTPDVVSQARERYLEAYRRLTGTEPRL
jgi:phosphoribosylaminoimidazole-succinocarboxamide synthase